MFCAVSANAQSPDVMFLPCDDCGIGEYQMAAGMGGGVGAADVNNDGHIDLFVPTEAGTPHQFYLNDGDGTFTDIAGAAGLDSAAQGRCALWFDADCDGDLDLVVANDDPAELSTYRLYEQTAPLMFADATESAGLFMPLPAPLHPGDPPHRGGMVAGDLNNDGALDLVTCLWNGQPQVFLNDGAGGFADISATAGVVSSVDYPWQPVLFDVNRDGWIDIYLAVDFRWNGLFINQGNNTFVDIAPAAHADSAWNDMGIALGDHDRDGDQDIYITNITAPGTHNVLLRNQSIDSSVDFVESSQPLDVDDGGWGWGCTFIDIDNDGWQDIAATNGWHSASFAEDESRLFWNRLGEEVETFADVSAAVAFDDVDWGSCLIAADLDRDGRQDLVQTCNDGPLRILMNRRPPARGDLADTAHWITIQPRTAAGTGPAIGAEVTVEIAGEPPLTRIITAGTSFLGQEPAEAHFGLGMHGIVDRVEVRWLDGTCSERTNVAAGQVLVVTDDDVCVTTHPADVDSSGSVGLGDLLTVLANWGTCESCDLCPSDFTGPAGTPDCDVNGNELVAVLLNWGQ